MALGFTRTSNEEFLPILKFNSVSGDMVVSSNVRGASGEWEKQEKEVRLPTKFVFDFANIEIGWMHFGSTGPSFALVKLGQPIPPLPADHDKVAKKYNQGFRIKLYSKEHGVCVLSQSSKTVGEAMDELHNQFVKEEKANTGKVAVVEINGTKKVSVSTKEGKKNYKAPEWSIVSWVPRPEALTEKVAEPEPVKMADDSDDF